MPTESSLLAWTDDPGPSPGYPFRGPGTLTRVAPFAAIAVLSEASLLLTPGPASMWGVVVSLALLFTVAASFALPWARLPGWMPVLVPLAYAGSALSLTLAAGTTSGVGIVVLVPLIWTALFQRRWESGCVLAAIVVIEIVVSLTPVTDPDGVIVRRIILWAALGTVIAFAAHELRDRGSRSRQEAARLQAEVTQLTVINDRDRIAADLQDKVIQQLFAAGMNLQSTAMLAKDREVRKRVLASADDLDHVLRLARDAVFDLGRRHQGRGLRAEIVALCARISPVPEVSFTGPADDTLDPALAAQLVRTLRDALEVMRPHLVPGRVFVTTSATACTVEIEAAGPAPDPGDAPGGDPSAATIAATGADPGAGPAWLAMLEKGAAEGGISLGVRPVSDGIRFTWSIPVRPASDEP
ncbi:MAG TPA: histidine kinase [Trebonia sp.]|jgi:signal transduction histidine kinase|nr:histidine kinase [Trebonia sp.]